MKLLPVILCLFFALFSSCNEINPKGEKEIPAFVKQWNDAHTQLKAPYLESSYMDVVQYYGVEQTKLQVQQDKLLLFEQFPDYKQQILNDQLTITKEGGSYLVVFVKNVQYNGVEAAYESYLSIALENSKFKILREGVAEDKNYLDDPIFPSSREKLLKSTANRQLFGDFNGDDLSDYAYVESPLLLSENLAIKQGDSNKLCKGDCTSVLHFSAKDLTAITIENAYKSQLDNLQDLNDDGADEIGFWNIKPNSKTLYIFDATTSKLLTPPVTINTTIHKDLNLIDVFKKTGPKKITVTRSVERDGNWVLVSEVVKLD